LIATTLPARETYTDVPCARAVRRARFAALRKALPTAREKVLGFSFPLLLITVIAPGVWDVRSNYRTPPRCPRGAAP